jgi:hypothetical protein
LISTQKIEVTSCRRFRDLSIVDIFSRKFIAIVPGKILKGGDVESLLEKIRIERGLVPTTIQ